MNSTQYLIILITAVVGFCIYVVAEIVRLRQRMAERQADVMRGWVSPYHRYITYNEAVRMSMAERYRLTEEIRTRLEGGDGA